MRWLRELVGVTGARAMAFEAPLVRAGGNEFAGAPSNRHSVILTVGLAFAAQVVASERGMVVHGVTVQDARKHFVGNRYAKKADVIARCQQLGWGITQHDAADSAAVWDWAKSRFYSSYANKTAAVLAGVQHA